jgi:hypothetical protein
MKRQEYPMKTIKNINSFISLFPDSSYAAKIDGFISAIVVVLLLTLSFALNRPIF